MNETPILPWVSDIFCHQTLTKNCYFRFFLNLFNLLIKLRFTAQTLVKTKTYLPATVLNMFGTMFDLIIRDLRKVKRLKQKLGDCKTK